MRTLRGAWLLCALLLPLPLAAQDPAALREQAKAVLARHGCQDHLPGRDLERGGGAADTPTNRRSGDVAPGEWRSRRSHTIALGSIGFADLVLWTVVGIAVAGIIALVLRSVGERAAGKAAATRLRATPAAPAATVALPDYEAFAATGDFAAAIHALLQHALQHLQQRLGGLRPSTTGREALRAARALPAGEPALHTLVAAVERTRFGGQPAAHGDFVMSKDALARWSTACAQPQ